MFPKIFLIKDKFYSNIYTVVFCSSYFFMFQKSNSVPKASIICKKIFAKIAIFIFFLPLCYTDFL